MNLHWGLLNISCVLCFHPDNLKSQGLEIFLYLFISSPKVYIYGETTLRGVRSRGKVRENR